MQQTPEPKPDKDQKLPKPKNEYGIPANKRLPLHGKMQPPTVHDLSAKERLWLMEENKKKKKRKGFVLGLWVGQLLILLLSFGGEALLRLFPNYNVELPFPLVVFAGISVSLLFMGILIDLLLFFQAVGYLIRPKGKKFGRALWNGIRRVMRASFSWGITVLVFCGTSLATIPMDQWGSSADRLKEESVKVYEQIKERVLTSPPPDASSRP